jgi:hypothetical protein
MFQPRDLVLQALGERALRGAGASARARSTGRPVGLRRSGDCPTYGSICARRGGNGRANPSAEISASGIGRRQTGAFQTAGARNIDNLRHSGTRLTDWIIGAGPRGRAGRESRVWASRINRRQARTLAVMRTGRIKIFRRRGFRARDGKIRSCNGRPRHPGRGTTVRASRIDRQSARGGAAICAPTGSKTKAATVRRSRFDGTEGRSAASSSLRPDLPLAKRRAQRKSPRGARSVAPHLGAVDEAGRDPRRRGTQLPGGYSPARLLDDRWEVPRRSAAISTGSTTLRAVLAEIGRLFHETLSASCAARGLPLVDCYAMTVGSDGFANLVFHVDGHKSPPTRPASRWPEPKLGTTGCPCRCGVHDGREAATSRSAWAFSSGRNSAPGSRLDRLAAPHPGDVGWMGSRANISFDPTNPCVSMDPARRSRLR